MVCIDTSHRWRLFLCLSGVSCGFGELWFVLLCFFSNRSQFASVTFLTTERGIGSSGDWRLVVWLAVKLTVLGFEVQVRVIQRELVKKAKRTGNTNYKNALRERIETNISRYLLYSRETRSTLPPSWSEHFLSKHSSTSVWTDGTNTTTEASCGKMSRVSSLRVETKTKTTTSKQSPCVIWVSSEMEVSITVKHFDRNDMRRVEEPSKHNYYWKLVINRRKENILLSAVKP